MNLTAQALKFLTISSLFVIPFAAPRAEEALPTSQPSREEPGDEGGNRLLNLVQNQAALDGQALSRLNELADTTNVFDDAASADIDGLAPSDELKDLWKPSTQKTLGEVFQIYEALRVKWENEETRLGLTDAVFKQTYASKGLIATKLDGLGVAELNVIDGEFVVRVVHQATEIAFVIGTELQTDTPHFRQFIARQHISAGRGRADGQSGRDVVVISKSSRPVTDQTERYDPRNYQRFDRADSRMSFAYWSDYWNAIKKAPTKSNITFGTVCGISQMALAFCVNGLQFAQNPSKGFDFSPGLLSAGWGAGIGIFISTYKNWTNLGTKLSRTLKSAINSALFGYTLMAIHKGNVESLLILDYNGVMMHTTVIGNILANNLARTFWNDLSRVREEIGVSRKPYVLNLPWPFKKKSIETVWQQSAVENQAVYLAPFSIRLLDYINFTVQGVPLGKVLLWSSIPGVEYLSLRYLEKMARTHLQSEKAQEMATEARSKWNLRMETMVGDLDLFKLRKELLWSLLTVNIDDISRIAQQIAEFPQSNAPSLAKLRLKKLWSVITRNSDENLRSSQQLANEYPQYFDKPHQDKPEYREAKQFDIPDRPMRCEAALLGAALN